MTILLFGKDGQLGTEFSKCAEQAGISVSGINRDDLDLADKIAIKQAIENMTPDLVINCAGYTNVDGAETHQNEANIVNGDAVAAMARACADGKIPLIQLSTDYVFSGTQKTPYTTDHDPSPLNAYGLSKLIGEQAAEVLCPKHIVLRTGWVFSETGNNFVKSLITEAKGRQEIDVIEDQFGSPTSARSVAQALLTIAQAIIKPDFEDWGIYHYTNTPQASWHSFAQSILETANIHTTITPVKLEDYRTQAPRPPYVVMDCSKTWEVFDLSPIGWQEELKRVIYTLQTR